MGWPIVVLSFLCPPLGIPFGFYGLHKDYSNWRKYIFCIALALGAFAYSFNPTGSTDLVAYFMHFEDFGAKTFWEAVTYTGRTRQGLGTNLYTAYAFFWLIGRIGDFHIAPAISTMLIYYIGYYITCRIGEDLNVPLNKIIKYLVFITVTINFYGIVNNIRNVFAFAVIGYAVFRDCYENKRNVWTYILYIFPVFFHTSAILFIFIRLALFIPGRFKWGVAVALLGVRSLINVLQNNIYRISGSNPLITMFKFAIAKGYTFYNETTETSGAWGRVVAQSGSLKLSRYCYIAIALLFIIVAINEYRRKNAMLVADCADGANKNDVDVKRFDKIYLFAVYLGAITLSTVTMLTPEYWRFVSAFILYAGVIYLSYPFKDNAKRLSSICFEICFYILSPICTVLWVREFVHGAELLTLLFKPFISSPIIVIAIVFLNTIL